MISTPNLSLIPNKHLQPNHPSNHLNVAQQKLNGEPDIFFLPFNSPWSGKNQITYRRDSTQALTEPASPRRAKLTDTNPSRPPPCHGHTHDTQRVQVHQGTGYLYIVILLEKQATTF